jgi:hypothetical protein
MNTNVHTLFTNGLNVIESLISILIKLKFKNMFSTYDNRNMHDLYINLINNSNIYYDYFKYRYDNRFYVRNVDYKHLYKCKTGVQ